MPQSLRDHRDAARKEWRALTGVSCHRETVSRPRKKLHNTRKKTRRAAEPERPETQEQRARFPAELQAVAPSGLVFRDESGA